ncbi:MAG: DUF58 domain-containing protein [Bacteroidetes bacterium]|nr:MAG: DUF58 domain-containing protein [Bacteroidota bacterium]
MLLEQQQLQRLSHLELLAKQVVEGFITGLHKSPFHGFSVEFAEHRIYNTGEPTRHMDWKLFARTDKLFVKRYEEETNLRCQIVIDDSSSMNFPAVAVSPPYKRGIEGVVGGNSNKLSFSVHAAAALAYLLKKQRDAVGLTVFSDKVELNTRAKSSPAHQRMIFVELEKLLAATSAETHKKSFTANALHEIAESIHKRSLVIIFSDMMESRSLQGGGERESELFSALQHLRHNKHEVILFHVTDKSKELNFEFENRPYNFIDMETGENVKVHPSEIKDTYVRSMAAYKKELMLHCAHYRIDFVEADINEGFKQVLMPYLIKRYKMQ